MLTLLLELGKRFWPQIALGLAGAAVGFSLAWSLQGLRLDDAKTDLVEMQQQFESYKQHIRQQEIEAAERANAAREQASADYRRLRDDLEKQIAAGDAYRRCVAAGKCGAWVRDVQAGRVCPSVGISPAGGVDGPGTDPVPAAGEPAAPGVVADCAYTTLQLNRLQADIADQPGYRGEP